MRLWKILVLLAAFLVEGLPAFAKQAKKGSSKTTVPQSSPAKATEETDTPENSADLEVETPLSEAAARTSGIWLGLGVGLPEVMRIDTGYWFSKWFGIGLFASPPVPVNLNVETPTIVLSATAAYRVQTAPTTLAVKGQYGPHAGLDLYLKPGTQSFYLLLGAEYRRVTAQATGQSPLYVCATAAKSCPGNDASGSNLLINGNISGASESLALRAGLGWFWDFGGEKPGKNHKSVVKPAPYYCNFTLGAFVPIQTKRSYSVTAEAETKLTPAIQKIVQSYIDSVLATFEEDVDAELNKQLDPYDKSPLPILEFSVGMRI